MRQVSIFSSASAGSRSAALVIGFWVIISAILTARVALFDEIASARVAEFVSTQVASLTAVILR